MFSQRPSERDSVQRPSCQVGSVAGMRLLSQSGRVIAKSFHIRNYKLKLSHCTPQRRLGGLQV
jgi:hypothetical protein